MSERRVWLLPVHGRTCLPQGDAYGASRSRGICQCLFAKPASSIPASFLRGVLFTLYANTLVRDLSGKLEADSLIADRDSPLTTLPRRSERLQAGKAAPSFPNCDDGHWQVPSVQFNPLVQPGTKAVPEGLGVICV